MQLRRFLAVALCLFLLAPAGTGFTASRRLPLESPVPGSQSSTYLDLASSLVVDLAQDGSEWRGARLDDAVVEKLRIDQDWPDGLILRDVELVELTPDDTRAFAVLFDFGASGSAPDVPALLALYTSGDSPTLLDVIDVGLDSDTAILDGTAAKLGPGSDLILVGNRHSNAEQAYAISTMVMRRGDTLHVIDEVLTFSEFLCGLARTQEPRFSLVADGGSAMAAIHVEVDLKEVAAEEDCAETANPAPSRTVDVTYRWNASSARYEPDSTVLTRLAEENEQRF